VTISPDWYDGFFEGEWLDYLALPTDQQWTDRQADFIVEHLELGEGARVLDLACGRGRIAIALAQRGCRVTGLDLSPRSLELARADAETAGVTLELVHRDMRGLDAEREFNAVVCVFSSFGYFVERADDERVLAAVARALVPGGRFLLDMINPVALAPEFVPREWHAFDDGTILLEERSYDHLRGRHESTWTFVHADGTRSERRTSIRGYTAAELVEMLRAVALEIDASWGSWDGTPLGDGTRTILRAHIATT
jgi:SAM-dependent methyltransferase